MALKGVATTIEDLSTALSLADENGMSVEEKRKLKKKVGAARVAGRMCWIFLVQFCFWRKEGCNRK